MLINVGFCAYFLFLCSVSYGLYFICVIKYIGHCACDAFQKTQLFHPYALETFLNDL